MIAAATGNATDIAGTAGQQNVQILPLRAFNLLREADNYLVSLAIYRYFIGEVNAGETGGYAIFWLKPGAALTAGQSYTLHCLKYT